MIRERQLIASDALLTSIGALVNSKGFLPFFVRVALFKFKIVLVWAMTGSSKCP